MLPVTLGVPNPVKISTECTLLWTSIIKYVRSNESTHKCITSTVEVNDFFGLYGNNGPLLGQVALRAVRESGGWALSDQHGAIFFGTKLIGHLSNEFGTSFEVRFLRSVRMTQEHGSLEHTFSSALARKAAASDSLATIMSACSMTFFMLSQ